MTDLHDTLLTLDTHIDIPWPDAGDAWSHDSQRQFDIRKANRGGQRAVCLAAYIPQTALSQTANTQPVFKAAWSRAEAMLRTINALGSVQDGIEAVIGSDVAGIRAITARQGTLAIIPAVENGHAIGDDPARIETLARKYGVRYITLTHNGHNALADAAIPRADLGDVPELHGGLSALGHEVIAEMNRHGIVVDVSHTARSTMTQAVRASTTPVIASHSCARALCDHPRNLDDGQLDLLRETGGVVQVTAMGSFLRKGGGGTLDDLARHVSYIAERIGVAHVGVSSDFDGGGGIDGWRNSGESRAVTHALEREGFPPEEIAAIWGGNALRVFEAAEAACVSC